MQLSPPGPGYSSDPDEATPKMVGKFIAQTKLEAWWAMMQQYCPQVFPEDDPCPTQHSQGTRLMTYFDNDPEKPMRVEVLGSNIFQDIPKSEPRYIIRFKDGEELSCIPLTSAHKEGGWQVGWDVPPQPSS